MRSPTSGAAPGPSTASPAWNRSDVTVPPWRKTSFTARQRRPSGPVGQVILRELTPEQAATALCELFLRTGVAHALVSDPDEVRRLARRDCRRRGIRRRTIAAGDVVVLHDDKYDALLTIPDGQALLRRDAASRRRRLPISCYRRGADRCDPSTSSPTSTCRRPSDRCSSAQPEFRFGSPRSPVLAG